MITVFNCCFSRVLCYHLIEMMLKVTAHSNNRNSESTREVILGSVRL